MPINFKGGLLVDGNNVVNDSQFSTLQTQLNGYNERLTKVEGTYVTKLELYEALKRGEISSEVEKVYTSEINYITENVMPSGKVTKILGKTEKSENQIVFSEVPQNTINGVTYKVEGGVITLNGTNTSSAQTLIRLSLAKSIPNGTYSMQSFNAESASLFNIDINNGNNEYCFYLYGYGINTRTGVVVDKSTENMYALIKIPSGTTLNNVILHPMLVQGSVAPTEWKQGYSGLKHTHITGLKSTRINLWDEVAEVGGIDPNTGANASGDLLRSKNYIEVVPNESYYFKFNNDPNNRVFYYDKNKNYITYAQLSSGILVVPPLCCYVRFRLGSSYGTTYNHDICINKSDPTINGNHYPYEQDTLEVDFEGNEWDYVDVEEGKRYEESVTLNLGDLSWTIDSYGNWVSNNLQVTGKQMLECLCSKYPIVNEPKDVDYGVRLNVVGEKVVLHDKDTLSMTSEQFKAYVNGVSFAYRRATPIVTDVSVSKDGWIDNLIQGGSITQEVDTTDTSALIAKEVDIAVNVVVDNQ